jgi:acyl carrier protein
MENLEKRVSGLISKSLKLAEDSVKLESSFIDDLGADSLDIVELVMALEDEFQIEIPDKDAEAIRTVQDAVTYIKEHQ